MHELFSLICKETAELIHEPKFIETHKNSPQAFTRKRKIGFSENVAFILNSLSRSLQIEIDDFVNQVMGKKRLEITKQAFSKSRKNISWKAFYELFELSQKLIFKQNIIRRFNGYRIFAIDASELIIDRTHDVGEYFATSRWNGLETKSNARISILTDALDGFVIDAAIDTLEKSERSFAKDHLNVFNQYCNEKDIIIFDRGYPSKEMISVISNMSCKYLMRLQSSSFKGVSQNSEHDFYITVSHGKDNYQVRVIKVLLKTGETEILITNLDINEFTTEAFQTLYAMRWSVETTYNKIKNKLLIEKFSGRTVLSIHQDFFATMFLTNCVSAVSIAVNKRLALKKKSCGYEYKANQNLIVGYLKFRLACIILKRRNNLLLACKKIIKMCLKQPVPIKPNRSFARPKFSHQRKVVSPKYAI